MQWEKGSLFTNGAGRIGQPHIEEGNATPSDTIHKNPRQKHRQ